MMCCECEKMGTCEDYKEDIDKVALYSCLNDVYKHGFPVRRKLLSKLVSHLLRKFGDETAIYILMDVMRESRKVSK